VYTDNVRRIQIYLDESTDRRLAAEAARRGVSKASLIRQLVDRGFPEQRVDPIDALVGAGDGEPVDDIDEAIYGR